MNRHGFVAIAATLVLLLVAAIPWPTGVDACQKPPDNVECHLIPVKAVVKQGEPFDLDFTLVNKPMGTIFPPPFRDDLDFTVTSTASLGQTCRTTPPKPTPGEGTVAPFQYGVQLDEAWSPYADQPTSDTRRLTVTPTTIGEVYGVRTSACGGDVASCPRSCQAQACVEAVADPASRPVPYALFLEPVRAGDAGAVLPFDLRVLRNGYTPGRPLTVRVIPDNRSDPIDIFPLTPPGLSTTGYVMTGNDEMVKVTCALHFPCFVGVDNLYHVTISDGATVVWDSRWVTDAGIGRALVNRAPITRQELIEVRDDGADGALSVGEHGFIHLRLYARNPFFATPFDAVTLDTPLPAGLTVSSVSLHFHDNPMDTTTPTPAELAATGTVTTPPGAFHVDVTQVIARFMAPPFDPPPTVFKDLFEVDLELETLAGGFPSARDLVFPGLTVAGTTGTTLHGETSAPLTVKVASRLPPNRVPALYAAKRMLDVDFAWDDSPVDPLHAAATSYGIYRSVAVPASGYAKILDVPDTTATRESSADPGAVSPALPGSTLHFYRAVAFNRDGDSGDIP